MGWKPLLKRNLHLYSNVEELKQYYLDNQEELLIIDECEQEISLDELSKKLLYIGAYDEQGEADENGYRWTNDELS